MKNKEKLEGFKELLDNEDFARMWVKLHTPLVRNSRKINRNEVCPFCNSGKKFKNCECYKTYSVKYSNYQNKI